jgi:hypothetical protein
MSRCGWSKLSNLPGILGIQRPSGLAPKFLLQYFVLFDETSLTQQAEMKRPWMVFFFASGIVLE